VAEASGSRTHLRSKVRSTGLKPAPSTSQEWLPGRLYQTPFEARRDRVFGGEKPHNYGRRAIINVTVAVSLLGDIEHHGYAFLFGFVLIEALGIPVPAAPALLVAGAAASRGPLSLPLAFASALMALWTGDTVMFTLGRRTGWWLLSKLCRLSLNPESCILRSADSFYRRGRSLLMIAKFIPGLNTMAPALAGSMNMRYSHFAWFDLAGASLYAGGYLLVGFAFSDAIEVLTHGVETFGRVVGWVLAIGLIGYLIAQVWLWRKHRAWRSVPFVEPAVAAAAVTGGDGMIFDVRSHGYYDPRALRIQGSRRLNPNALQQSPPEFPDGKEIFVYCTCVREATSARVAFLLRARGLSAVVIRGGLRAWQRAGLPVEPVPAAEMEALPIFET
jgi:membrane protein DedA with SNARE-associated domain/rhodanese-related sulfurtransferase